MTGGQIIREARKRASLSQRELAERLGTTQAVVARWETAYSAPSFDRVVEAVRACGFELATRITTPDHEHALLVEEALRMTPEERLERIRTSRRAVAGLLAEVKRGS